MRQAVLWVALACVCGMPHADAGWSGVTSEPTQQLILARAADQAKAAYRLERHPEVPPSRSDDGSSACCLPWGVCAMAPSEEDCLFHDGVWHAGLECDQVQCTAFAGACCYFPGACVMVTEAAECVDGEFLGIGHTCEECAASEPCPPETLAGHRAGVPTQPSGLVAQPGGSVGFLSIDEFTGVNGKIGGIHWWGEKGNYDSGLLLWDDCYSDSPMEFVLKFYRNDGDHGMPGTEVCSYTVTPTMTWVGPYGAWSDLYYFSVDDLSPCCVLDQGWVSIQSLPNPENCIFRWRESPDGDGFSYIMQHLSIGFTVADVNLAYCLMPGDCPAIHGACCDDYTGECVDNAEEADCVWPLRFAPNMSCDDVSATCGITGACCDAGLECAFTGYEADCDAIGGRFWPGESCDTYVCRDVCVHRIDLHQCDWGIWGGNKLDVLVNGNVVLSQISKDLTGPEPWSYEFMAATGDTIETIYYPSYAAPEKPYYSIYDGQGYLIGQDGIILGGDCSVAPSGITVAANCDEAITGACCYISGGCDQVSGPGECVDGEFLGFGSQCWQCPVYVTCPPEAIMEPEPCGSDTNSGCDTLESPFSPIECGDTICGTLWISGILGGRDSDWYQLTPVTEPRLLTWTVRSETPVEARIERPGAQGGGCGDRQVLTADTAEPGSPVSVSIEAQPGETYWLVVDIPLTSGAFPCEQDYVASVTCDPISTGACCLWTGECAVVSPVACDDQGGTYHGDDMPCESVECLASYCPAGTSVCDGRHISRVQMGTIDNSTGCSLGNGSGNYAHLSVDLSFGESRTLVVTQGGSAASPWDGCAVWIDYNHDLDFSDAGEFMRSGMGMGFPAQYTIEIEPPVDALPGPTRMRVRLGASYAAPWVQPQPCGMIDNEEVEDYTVNILDVVGACCHSDGTCSNELSADCDGSWAGPFTACSFQDCDGNGTDDFCDIQSGAAQDCDQNGILDTCDIANCDGSSWCQDCNANDVPDGCEPDCNGNGVADECDIANCDGSPWCQDCNQNGTPDGCEPDCNQNDVADECDMQNCDGSPWCQDCNWNGMLDVCDITPGVGYNADCNANGIPDECDVWDCDGSAWCQDCNWNNVPDGCEPDCNQNGVADECDLRDCAGEPWCQDCNNNDIPDECDIADCQPGELWCADCQSDGIPDECQLWKTARDGGVRDTQVMSWDDGSSETNIGLDHAGELAWVQQFTRTEPGVVQAIQVCFGSPAAPGISGVQPGDPFRVYVWSDPDGDGAPYDALLLASADGTVDMGSVDTDVFQSVPINAVVSGSFFVGASFYLDVPFEYPASLDMDSSQQRSWTTFSYESPLDPEAWSPEFTSRMDDLGWPGNWLLRAEVYVGTPTNDCNQNGIPDECDLCGDLDLDGDVDYDDYVIFLEAFGGETDGEPAQDWCCDYDDSGAVGMADFDAWLTCYRTYVNDPLAGPPTIGKRRIRVPVSPLPKQGPGPVPAP